MLFFHAGFGFGQGGFVGVDVFFVISGYLITSLIHGEMRDGRFSLLRFYERRARRLFPALFVVLLFCAVVSAWLLLPTDLSHFGGSLFAATLFASNVFFWLETGYFHTDAELKPLLHSWSLAVEEQFYLLFPLFVALLLKYRPRRLVPATIAVTLLSLVGSEWAVRHTASAAFYLAPFRAWELGIGAILALSTTPPPRPALLNNLLAWGGLALVVASVELYSWQTAFPGLHALLPCLGAALVIWTGTGSGSSLSRVLSTRPMVFTGLVSYSLYLWHWPMLVFARHYAIRELSLFERGAVLVCAALIAVLSWHVIERPFRGSRAILSQRRLFGATAVAMAFLCALGLAAVAGSGWPQRFDAAALELLAGAEDRNPRSDCSFLDAQDLRAGRACRLGKQDGREPTFIVWGDSHADALMPAFDRLAAEHGQAGLYLGKIGCPPLLDVERVDSPYRCLAYNAAARDIIASSPARKVVIVARWSHFTSQPTYGQEGRTRVVIADSLETSPSVRGNDAVLARGLDRTLDFLGQRTVFVVSTVPEIGYQVPEALAQARHLRRHIDIRPTLAEYHWRQRTVESMLDGARQRHAFTRIDPAAILCLSGRCSVDADGHPLYYDEHHLSTRGADAVASLLAVVFR